MGVKFSGCSGFGQVHLSGRSGATRVAAAVAGGRSLAKIGHMPKVPYESLLHLVLFQPEIPHNTGSVGRTCLAIRAKLWLVRPLGFQIDDYYLRRAGLDYWEHLDVEIVDDWQGLEEALIKPSQRKPWLFTKDAERVYTEARFQRGDILIFGRESSGLPAWMHERYADQRLRIPIQEPVRSLNVSNVAAIVAYEALRQGI
jgi:tRNA (cytidine/uridine-2'-O-)-methyltransferase